MERIAEVAGVLAANLPSQYEIVVAPVIDEVAFDLIVVQIRELVVLHLAANTRPSLLEKRKAAVRILIAAESIDRDFPIQHVFVASSTEKGAGVTAVTPIGAVEIILASHPVATLGEDSDTAHRLLRALRLSTTDLDRQATTPFHFRTAGRRASTVADAIHLMDRHPDDAIYHIQNGTLAHWLRQEEVDHLADELDLIMRHHGHEPRVALENFLLATGLVPRPILRLTPKWLDLGRIVAGQEQGARLRIAKGRGRGYLYGELYSPHAWLRCSAERLRGEPLDLTVWVDTGSLTIQKDPYQVSLRLECNAAATPVEVPVRFQIVGQPTPLLRFWLRPLAGGILAGAFGLLLGFLFVRLTPLPSTLPDSAVLSLITLIWASLGVYLGLRQPPTWALVPTIIRRMFGLLSSLGLLGGTGLFILTTWPWLLPDQTTAGPIVITLLCLAIFPTTLVELRLARAEKQNLRPLPRSWRQSVRRGVRVLVVLLILLSILALVSSLWQAAIANGTDASVQAQVEEQWRVWNVRLNGWVDELTARYYEGRRGSSADLVPDWIRRLWQRIQN